LGGQSSEFFGSPTVRPTYFGDHARVLGQNNRRGAELLNQILHLIDHEVVTGLIQGKCYHRRICLILAAPLLCLTHLANRDTDFRRNGLTRVFSGDLGGFVHVLGVTALVS
jgi:hypothetical protein